MSDAPLTCIEKDHSCLYFRRNILDSQNKSYLTACRYNSSDPDDKLCPIFELGQIIEEAGENYNRIAIQVKMLMLLFLNIMIILNEGQFIIDRL